MAYTNLEGRTQLLADLAEATDELAVAVAALGDAYEHLDEVTGDRMEAALFRPVQHAYGRAKRTHSEFAGRHGVPGRAFAPGLPSAGNATARALIDKGVGAARTADERIAALQDSMLPVEVGDAEVRAGLAEIREILGPLPGRAREFARTLGR